MQSVRVLLVRISSTNLQIDPHIVADLSLQNGRFTQVHPRAPIRRQVDDVKNELGRYDASEHSD